VCAGRWPPVAAGTGVAFAYWAVWTTLDDAWQYPAEWLMGLMVGVPVLALIWAVVLLAGYLLGRLVYAGAR
jgi:hypothetical protein